MSLHPVRANHESDLRSPASSTETFTDVNVSGLLHLATGGGGGGSGRPGPPLASWAAELSASFGIIAEQLQHASRAIATHPLPTTPGAAGAADHLAVLTARLDAIEQAQERLAVELAALRSLHAGKSRAPAPNEFLPDAALSASSGTTAASLADLERRLADMLAAQKLDQDRLYARLHNSRVTVSKMPIMALPTTSGKPPPNHPNTKGEFEHLTKERYEGLLKAYDQPIKGDTAAKREALRIFLGLPA
ncbi:hypothetical protein BJY52DRAFT_1193279 [Lactarius psammicola]|nr:hypothetical protein BJY52DRAFT_1193279 [Lactarius psammicola]